MSQLIKSFVYGVNILGQYVVAANLSPKLINENAFLVLCNFGTRSE